MKPSASVDTGAARRLFSVLTAVWDTDRWRLELWDGSSAGEAETPEFILRFRSRRGLDRLVGDLPDRGFGRAYAEGSLEVEGLYAFLARVNDLSMSRMARLFPRILTTALALGARPDPRRIRVEAHLRGRLHSRVRDSDAIRHHYDQPPEFYRLFLGRTLTYSCAYFETPDTDLDSAQEAKLEMVCRKLRLRPEERFLDIGCGWGSLVIHAAQHWGVRALGITASPRQAEWAAEQVRTLGLEGKAEIRLADYRDGLDGEFDAIASVGMVEHVGRRAMAGYCEAVHGLLRPEGRALIHGITNRPGKSGIGAFLNSFVFPDGELQEVGSMVTALQASGLEVRDVESLREHYALTLRNWVERLEAGWDDAVALVGLPRARVWDLYMSGSRVGFEQGSIGIHQLLAVRQGGRGESGLPLTRADWYQAERRSAVGV
ncbi:MAG: cyclopropane-fatty-acyl-phospholipid synthase family protein [Candidatus Dormibacteria bacterium]|jgi:cyclopropane-fatty-acyl-phospholipid synthase